MTLENKKRVRDEIAKDSKWVIVDGILGEEISVLDWDKEVEIIYEDMDNQPCKCNAICEHKSFGSSFFRATNGMAKGNRMCGVIAYRSIN